MRAESECIKEEFQLEILLLAEEGRFWQICSWALPLTQQGTVSQTFVAALLKVLLRQLSQTSLITKIQCLPFLLRSLKMFYLICSLFTYIKYIFVLYTGILCICHCCVICLLFAFSVNFCACASNSAGKLSNFSL